VWHVESNRQFYPECKFSFHSLCRLFSELTIISKKLGKRATKAGNVFLLPEYPYKSVHALLLVFEDDDLGTSHEVDQLFQVFKNDLHVTTSKKFRIPSKTPFAVLEKLLCDWKAKYSRPESLLIVYFGGHGYQDDFYRIRFSAK
jgi:hypothetical protein